MPSKDETLGMLVDLMGGLSKGVSRDSDGNTHLGVIPTLFGMISAGTDRRSAAEDRQLKRAGEERAISAEARAKADQVRQDQEAAWKKEDRPIQQKKARLEAIKLEAEANNAGKKQDLEMEGKEIANVAAKAETERKYGVFATGEKAGQAIPKGYHETTLDDGSKIREHFSLDSNGTPLINEMELPEIQAFIKEASIPGSPYAPFLEEAQGKLIPDMVKWKKGYFGLMTMTQQLVAGKMDANFQPVPGTQLMTREDAEAFSQSTQKMLNAGISPDAHAKLLTAFASGDPKAVFFAGLNGMNASFTAAKVNEQKKRGGFMDQLGAIASAAGAGFNSAKNRMGFNPQRAMMAQMANAKTPDTNDTQNQE